MRWRKLTLGTRLAFIITLGFSVGIVALALTLIQLQSNAAAESDHEHVLRVRPRGHGARCHPLFWILTRGCALHGDGRFG